MILPSADTRPKFVLRCLRFRPGLPLGYAIGQVQEPEDEGETRKQEERVELQGGVRSRAAHTASDEAREQARLEGRLLPVNRVLDPVLVAVTPPESRAGRASR